MKRKNLTSSVKGGFIGINKEPGPHNVPHTGTRRTGIAWSVYGAQAYEIHVLLDGKRVALKELRGGIPGLGRLRMGCQKLSGGLWSGSGGMALDLETNHGHARTLTISLVYADAVYKKDENGRRVMGPDNCYLTDNFIAELVIVQEANPAAEPVVEEEAVQEEGQPDPDQVAILAGKVQMLEAGQAELRLMIEALNS